MRLNALRRFARCGQIGAVLWACVAVTGLEGFAPQKMAPQGLREHVTVYFCHGYLQFERRFFFGENPIGEPRFNTIPLPELPAEPDWKGFEGSEYR